MGGRGQLPLLEVTALHKSLANHSFPSMERALLAHLRVCWLKKLSIKTTVETLPVRGVRFKPGEGNTSGAHCSADPSGRCSREATEEPPWSHHVPSAPRPSSQDSPHIAGSFPGFPALFPPFLTVCAAQEIYRL